MGYNPELIKAENDVSRVADEVASDWDALRNFEGKKDNDLTIFSAPRKGCKHCHGTGVEGAYTNESPRLPGQPCLCRCLTNRLIYHPWNPDPVRLTYGAFKQLMRLARQRYNLKEQNDEPTNEVGNDPVQGISQEDNPGRDEVKASGDNREAV